MCKIVAFTSSKKLDIQKTVNKVGNILLDYERDGFGYAVKGVKGVYGEKCIDDDFKSRANARLINPSNIVVNKYSMFGEVSKPTGAMILHGRTSTNDKGLVNCHPMIEKGCYLIHNGVVSDYGPKYAKVTSNDSEDVLHRHLIGINDVEKHLSGYYAYAIINDDNNRLEIVRDDVATLFMAWVEKYETYIIATTVELMKEIATSMKFTLGPIDAINSDIYVIFDNNEVVFNADINPRGFTYQETQYSGASLGFDLDKYTEPKATESSLSVIDDTDSYTSITSEYEFDAIINGMDSSWKVLDQANQDIGYYEFITLTTFDKRQCLLIDPEGRYYELLYAA